MPRNRQSHVGQAARLSVENSVRNTASSRTLLGLDRRAAHSASSLWSVAQGRLCPTQGFSLIEMMVVLAIISIIMGSVFKSIDLTQRVSRSQQVKLDLTQQSREFVDQLTRDLRNSGYPYQRNMTNMVDPANSTNFISPTHPYNAPGLIYVDKGSLWFAGNVDGTPGAEAGTAAVK